MRRLALPSLLLGAAIASFAPSALTYEPEVEGAGDDHPYRGSFGDRYQYDLSRPADRLRYKYDPASRLRDRIDPRVKLDRSLGRTLGGRCPDCED